MQKTSSYTRPSISIYFYILGFIFSSWASRIPQVKDKFHLNEAELGGVLFMLPFGALAALPFSGWLVHRLSSRIMSIASALIYTILLYSIAIADTVFALSFILFGFGMIGNFGNISMNSQGISIQHRINKPILSSLHAMWSIGAFSAAAISGWTMKMGYSTAVHFTIVSLIAAVIIIAGSFFLIPDEGVDDASAKVFVLPNKKLILLGVICFCVAMSEGAMADWSSLYYRQVIHELNSISTTGYTAFAMCMAAGRLMGDKLVQSFKHSTVLKMNGMLIVLGMLLSLSFSFPSTVMMGFALVGFGVSSVIPIVYMLAAKTKDMAPSVALAAVSSVGFTGFLVGPPAIGFIAHEIGLRSALVVVVMLGIMITLLSSRVKQSN
ncbi:MAG: MFS transporter [Chitinophagaceae bacterium]